MRLIFLCNEENKGMFDKKKSIKRAGMILIAVVVLVLIVCGIKVKSVSDYQAQKAAEASEQQKLSEIPDLEKAGNGNLGDETQNADAKHLATADSSAADGLGATATNTGTETGNADTTAAAASDSKQNSADMQEEPAGNTLGNGAEPGNTNDTAGNTGNGQTGAGQQPGGSGETQTAYVTCTIEIRCDAAAAKKSQINNPGIRDSIPDDGIILNKTTYVVKAGSSVYDVLCNVKDIRLTVTPSGYGKYVSGINNLEQKMVGANSGWVYLVNGSLAQKAADHFIVADGDAIYWKYITEVGD
jgi:hypothetical protein